MNYHASGLNFQYKVVYVLLNRIAPFHILKVVENFFGALLDISEEQLWFIFLGHTLSNNFLVSG